MTPLVKAVEGDPTHEAQCLRCLRVHRRVLDDTTVVSGAHVAGNYEVLRGVFCLETCVMTSEKASEVRRGGHLVGRLVVLSVYSTLKEGVSV